MGNDRVVTAKLPERLVAQLDEIAARMERSKSWIIRQALGEWLAEERRRYELTLDALKSMDEGNVFTQEEVEEMAAELKRCGAAAKERTGSDSNKDGASQTG